ncbi:MAG: hypothetical protein OHK0029_29720 [Armatimonadaceae bacterium]
MSYRDPGGSFDITASPPAKRRSPWLFFGIGCGALTLALVAFVGTLIFAMRQEMQKPLDIKAVQKELGPQPPIYPGAKLDEVMTKAQRAGARFHGKTVVAFYTDQPSNEVFYWYDRVMPAMGYQSSPQPEFMGLKSAWYWKDDVAWQVSVQDQKDSAGGAIIILTKETEVPEELEAFRDKQNTKAVPAAGMTEATAEAKQTESAATRTPSESEKKPTEPAANKATP